MALAPVFWLLEWTKFFLPEKHISESISSNKTTSRNFCRQVELSKHGCDYIKVNGGHRVVLRTVLNLIARLVSEILSVSFVSCWVLVKLRAHHDLKLAKFLFKWSNGKTRKLRSELLQVSEYSSALQESNVFIYCILYASLRLFTVL